MRNCPDATWPQDVYDMHRALVWADFFPLRRAGGSAAGPRWQVRPKKYVAMLRWNLLSLAASVHVERLCGIIVGSVVGIVFHLGIVKVGVGAEGIVTRAAVHAVVAILVC